MRVAWICFYPASDFRSRPSLRHAREMFHPVPWITVQAPLVAAIPGVELHIVTVARDYSRDDHFEHQGVHLHFLKVPAIPRVLLLYQFDRRRIHDCLRAIQPDLVQGFGTEMSFAYSAVTSAYPSLVRMQGIMGRIIPALGRSAIVKNPALVVPLMMERWTIKRGRHFICTTGFAADFVHRLNASAVIHPIKTPVRDELFALERTPPPANEPVLLYVGSILPAKGIEVLVRAFAAVLREFPGARLNIVGADAGGYTDSVLLPLIAELGIGDGIVFHGFQRPESVAEFLRRASLLVLPTYMDTSPNVIVEAHAAGVPVVASSVGGIPEMVDHNRTGLLVPPGSIDALTAALLESLRDPQRAAQRAEVARAEAAHEYRSRSQVAKLVGVYRSILSEGASA